MFLLTLFIKSMPETWLESIYLQQTLDICKDYLLVNTEQITPIHFTENLS